MCFGINVVGTHIQVFLEASPRIISLNIFYVFVLCLGMSSFDGSLVWVCPHLEVNKSV